MTLDEARELGAEIARVAQLKAAPMEIPTERRALALKFAIDTEAASRPLSGTAVEVSGDILTVAGRYLAFIEGAEQQ